MIDLASAGHRCTEVLDPSYLTEIHTTTSVVQKRIRGIRILGVVSLHNQPAHKIPWVLVCDLGVAIPEFFQCILEAVLEEPKIVEQMRPRLCWRCEFDILAYWPHARRYSV